jgi:hypothetical protein
MRTHLPAIGKFLLLALLIISLIVSCAIAVRDLVHGQIDKLQEHFLAVVAIFAGVVAVIYELRLHHGFETQRKDIQSIVSEMTTRYLGTWPGDLMHITELVQKVETGSSLWILVDQIGYGCFSRQEEFSAYSLALQKVAHKKKIRILTYAETDAREGLKRQFKKYEGNFTALSGSQNFKDFQEKYNLHISTHGEFITAALYVQNEFYKAIEQAGKTGTGAFALRTITNPLPHEEIFCWLLFSGGEPKQMIFVYPQFAGSETGHAFMTQDIHLMEAFQKQFDRKWDNGSDSVGLSLYAVTPQSKTKGADAGRAAGAGN